MAKVMVKDQVGIYDLTMKDRVGTPLKDDPREDRVGSYDSILLLSGRDLCPDNEGWP